MIAMTISELSMRFGAPRPIPQWVSDRPDVPVKEFYDGANDVTDLLWVAECCGVEHRWLAHALEHIADEVTPLAHRASTLARRHRCGSRTYTERDLHRLLAGQHALAAISAAYQAQIRPNARDVSIVDKAGFVLDQVEEALRLQAVSEADGAPADATDAFVEARLEVAYGQWVTTTRAILTWSRVCAAMDALFGVQPCAEETASGAPAAGGAS